MRQVLQTALVVVATLVAYNAYQRYQYTHGKYSFSHFDRVLEAADAVNAREDPRVKALLEEAERTGTLNTRKLEEVLTQRARTAAELVRIREHFRNLGGYVPPPDPPPSRPERQPAPVAEPRQPAQEQRPIRLPSPVTIAAEPQGQPLSQRPEVVNDGRTLPTAGQLTSEDGIERRQAELALKQVIWRQHQNAFGLGSGSFGKMGYREFAEAFIKREYGEKAPLIKVPER